MRGSPITAAVAALALVVGASSAVGGIYQAKAADRKVCKAKVAVNASVRGLLDDFITQNPQITLKQKQQADDIALARFPRHC
jgi:hypothetical protein